MAADKPRLTATTAARCACAYADAIVTYLSLAVAIDKCADRNSNLCLLDDSSRQHARECVRSPGNSHGLELCTENNPIGSDPRLEAGV